MLGGPRLPRCDGGQRREGLADHDRHRHETLGRSRSVTERRLSIFDGDRLCELLKDYSIGVSTTERVVEDVKIEGDYFTSSEPK